MLKKPSCGWTRVVLTDEKGVEWSAPASYLTSVHNDCMDAFIDYYRTFRPQCIHLDAEGWDYMIVIERYYVYLIIRKDFEELKVFEITVDDLCEELIEDIERDIDAWSHFDCEIENEKDAKQAKKRIEHKLAHLKRVKRLSNKIRYGG